jgi:hypothetical protein
MSSDTLLRTPGRWIDDKTCEWGDWKSTESLLDELDIKHLKEVHYPFQFKSERAMTVKKALSANKPVLQLHNELKGMRGYSLRSLQKDAIALSRATSERNELNIRNSSVA